MLSKRVLKRGILVIIMMSVLMILSQLHKLSYQKLWTIQPKTTYTNKIFSIWKSIKFDVSKQSFSVNSTATSLPSQSFRLWKSIRLNPDDYKLNNKSQFYRYGDPLPLYIQHEVIRSQKNESWRFVPKSNDYINCEDVILKDMEVSEQVQAEITDDIRDKYTELIEEAKLSCKDFIKSAGYITDPLTQMEADFPIAFSILMYKDVEQFEILLRTIYRPQNLYCVHVDKKSPEYIHDEVKIIAECFDNVFVTSYSVDVVWAGFTNLEPEIICLRELWQSRVRWKYIINLTGQEFPLRTNYELVKILTSYHGANNVRWQRRIFVRMKNAGPLPRGLTPVKGAVHVTLSRDFVDFVLHNETSLMLYEWSRKVRHPDETYFNTLNYNRQLRAPGTFRGEPSSTTFITRFKHWRNRGNSCHGKFVRGVCIFGRRDLPLLATREELFINKLYFDYYPEVMTCMKELLFNRTAEEYEGRLDFNVTYYATRDFVKNSF